MNVREFSGVVASVVSGPGERLAERVARRLGESPRCGVARYLHGCAEFDHGRPATAVRNLMVAHHAAPALESAALLVFAGLNWVSRPNSPLLAVLLETWEEFRRPQFDRSRQERVLLDALAEPAEGLEHVSILARRLWRLPIGMLRSQIRTALAQRPSGPYGLLLAGNC